MKVKVDLIVLLFGELPNERLIRLLHNPAEASDSDARDILSRISHAEIESIIRELRGQMGRGVPEARFDLFHSNMRMLENYVPPKGKSLDPHRALFFSEYFRDSGYYGRLAELIERGHPGYTWQREIIPGQISFKRVNR